MDLLVFLHAKLSFLWETGVPFLVALTVLVFVHEWGHFIVARWCGVKVEVFSVGFGNELKGWTDKNGTRWKISAVPLGGYVKMFGEGETVAIEGGGEDEERPMTEEEKSVSFFHKPLHQRAAIVLAGPLINFIFAIFAFAFLFTAIGVGESVSDKPLAIVGSVQPGSAAHESGLKLGDRIIRLNDKSIVYFSDLQKVIVENPGQTISAKMIRKGKEISFSIKPKPAKGKNANGEDITIGLIGVRSHPGEIRYERQNPITAIGMGVERTYGMTVRILVFIGDLFSGDQSTDELGGILRIAQISGQVAELGIASFISFLAVLSINLGLINLFPIPMLDGGHLTFYAIEAIKGRPVGAMAQEYAFRFGLVLIIGLFVFVTWNDIVYLKDDIIDYFS